MLSSFFAAVVKRFRGRGRHRLGSSSRGCRQCAAPKLEVLEDRCLPSSTTIVPAFADIPPLVAYPDVLMAVQSRNNPSVVFVGDSINFGYAYGEGAPVWAALMAPLGAADYGIPGQTTQSLLYQLSLGQLMGINPSVVVLNIGGNNLLEGDTPQATAAGVLADVTTIHQYLPQVQVLVLGVLPGMQSPSDPYRLAGTRTDSLVRQMLAGDPRASFVSIGSVFLQPDGTISNTMMYDYLHPTTQGYLSLTGALLPFIRPVGVTGLSGGMSLRNLPNTPASSSAQQVSMLPS